MSLSQHFSFFGLSSLVNHHLSDKCWSFFLTRKSFCQYFVAKLCYTTDIVGQHAAFAKKKHERAKVPCVEKSSCWKDVLYGHIWNFFKSGLIKVGKWGIKICCKKWTFCKKEESLKKVKGSINIFANFTLDCMFKDNFILVQQGLLPNSKQ